MADYPIDFQLVADPVTFQRAANALVTVYDINDANNTTPLALKDLNGLPMANPMTSTAEAITPPFLSPAPDVKLVGGGYTIPATSAKGLRDAAQASATAAQDAANRAADAAALAGAPAGDVIAASFSAQDSPTSVAMDSRAAAKVADPSSSLRSELDGRYAGATVTTEALAGKASTASLAGKADKGSLVLNVKDYGAKGDGTTDDTAAIRAAVSDATPGSTIYFPRTGSGAWYKITDTITITTPNIRFLGNPRDIYAVSIRCSAASKVLLSIKAPGFVLQYMGLVGDATGANGLGSTQTGVELFGDTDGNVDANLWNATVQSFAVGVRVRGRNTTISSDTLFSNCLKAIVVDGKDATYHTGPGADQNRGNTIRQCRFHNIGAAATDSHIEILPAAKVLHMVITGNYFDSNGFGAHIRATGTSTNPHKGISMWSNKHTECQSEAYALTYVNFSTISDADILGYAASGSVYGNGFTLNNCDSLGIRNVYGVQIGKAGIYARNCPSLDLNNVNFAQVGQDGANTSHGFDIDSTNTNPVMTRLRVGSSPGWGFIGSPFQPSMIDCRFLTVALGAISSTTAVNRAALGRNTYIEGGMGRMEDEGRQVYDFSAGTAKQVATITGGGNYSSFLFTVEFTAANIGSDCYAFGRYSVRTENGVPVVTAVGAANVARVAITTAASGPQAITVALNCTAAASGTVIIRASAGGAANTTNPRGVTVAMA